jgi:hypothetical protein
MSDVFQATTPFNTNQLLDGGTAAGPVGVVPFVWAAANGTPSGVTNVTPQLAQYLFSAGAVPLSQFTGAHSDENDQIVATGRDPDSGTRLTAFAETGVGVTNTVRQFVATTSGTTAASYALYAQETVNGITVVAGNGGEASGGTLAGNLRFTGSHGHAKVNNSNLTNGYLLSYLGTNDAVSAAFPTTATNGTGPAIQLKYNGVNLPLPTTVDSNGVAALDAVNSIPLIAEGQYTFWGYEHLFYTGSFAGDGKTVADSIADQIANTTAIITIPVMQVQRGGDGLNVTSAFR